MGNSLTPTSLYSNHWCRSNYFFLYTCDLESMLRSVKAKIKFRVISEVLKLWQRGFFLCVFFVCFSVVFFYAVSDLS